MELYGSLYDNNLVEWQLILLESPCHPLHWCYTSAQVAGMPVKSSCHGMFETFLEVYVMIHLTSQSVVLFVRVAVDVSDHFALVTVVLSRVCS